VLRDFLDSFTPLARAPLPPEITFHANCHVSHEAVLLDAGSLQDSLLNLVLNARDAIGGSGAGSIALEASDVQDTWLDITVTDTGPGFDRGGARSRAGPVLHDEGRGRLGPRAVDGL
jgi:signal transduction histidine kinase